MLYGNSDARTRQLDNEGNDEVGRGEKISLQRRQGRNFQQFGQQLLRRRGCNQHLQPVLRCRVGAISRIHAAPVRRKAVERRTANRD